jgi:predicted transcriptional regulator
MALIPAQPVVEKETLSLRLERVVHERLKHYAAFIQSPKDYVIGQALRRLFEKDHEFAEWLRTHETVSAANAPVENGPAEEGTARMPMRARTAPLRAERSA